MITAGWFFVMYFVFLVLSASAVHSWTPSLNSFSSTYFSRQRASTHPGRRHRVAFPVRSITTMSTKEFFNRDEERKHLVNIITKESPYLWIMLGLPSTGKTALLSNVLDESGPDGTTKKFNSLRLNLRGTEVYSRESLFRVLRDAAKKADIRLWTPFVDLLSKFLSVNVDVRQVGGIEVKAKESSESNLEDQFTSLIAMIPVSADRPCVLLVDEANELKRLAQEDEKVSLSTQSFLY